MAQPRQPSPAAVPLAFRAPFTVAAAQLACEPGDVPANLAPHLALIRLAGEHKVDLLVFPELSLTGYELALAPSLAFTPNDAHIDPLAAACREVGLTAVVGAPLRLDDGQLCIASFVLRPDGFEHVYTKQHLDNEDPPFSPGFGGPLLAFSPPSSSSTSTLPSSPSPTELVALAICADTSVASHPLSAAGQGATLYAASSCISRRGYAVDTARLEGYARRHGMAILLANHARPTGGLDARGGSAIWAAGGEKVVEMAVEEAARPGLVVARRSVDGTGWEGEVVGL